MSSAEATDLVIDAIRLERRRQMHVEGWTPEHDDMHGHGQMAKAAACYAVNSTRSRVSSFVMSYWPWEWTWWKPKSPRRDLVRAAALIVAEIERLDRAKNPQEMK